MRLQRTCDHCAYWKRSRRKQAREAPNSAARTDFLWRESVAQTHARDWCGQHFVHVATAISKLASTSHLEVNRQLVSDQTPRQPQDPREKKRAEISPEEQILRFSEVLKVAIQINRLKVGHGWEIPAADPIWRAEVEGCPVEAKRSRRLD